MQLVCRPQAETDDHTASTLAIANLLLYGSSTEGLAIWQKNSSMVMEYFFSKVLFSARRMQSKMHPVGKND